jgi:hypothetical protein
MKLISIQKKPPLGWELLMVFIISLYFNPFISIPSFQFLMVRLKAYTKYNENFFSDISIPYGAIIFTKIQKYFYKHK